MAPVGDGSLIEALLDLQVGGRPRPWGAQRLRADLPCAASPPQADVNDLRLEVHARLEGISDRLARLIARHEGAAAVAPGATTD